MSLKEEIKALIGKKKISIAQLARTADVHQDTIYNFLNGNTEMTAANLDKLFEVLKNAPSNGLSSVNNHQNITTEGESQVNSPN